MNKYVERMKHSSPKVFAAVAAAKFLFGLGLGVLVIKYFPDAMTNEQWFQSGWILVAVAVVIGFVVLRELHKKRSLVEKITEKVTNRLE